MLRYFQCFYHATPEQGRVAKMSTPRDAKDHSGPCPCPCQHHRVRHKAALVHLKNMTSAAGCEAGLPIWQGSGNTATNPQLASLAALGKVFQK